MVRVFISLLLLLWSTHSLALTSVTATVDQNPVIKGESFILEVVADDDVDSSALDTSPLLGDFIVGRTSVSSQTSMVNFKTTRLTRWSTVLIAKNVGDYTIPALDIEGQLTKPIQVKVLSPNDNHNAIKRDIFITNDISQTQLFVQQNITLTVKLHFAVNLKRGSLSEPQLNGAIIKQLGQDKESDSIINGRRFRVIERTYTISPQESGEFTLKSPLFSGEIQQQTSGGRSNFFSFGETKSVSVIGQDISLSVNPIPDNINGQWLPAELLTVHDEWQPEPDAFKVGEPITRTITLTAAGLTQEQLPKLVLADVPGLKLYPDQATLHSSMNSGRLVSQKVQSFAVVASAPGQYEIPDLKVNWWNTVTNQAEVAIIEGQTINVLPNPNAVAAPVSLTPNVPAVSTGIEAPQVQIKEVEVYRTPWLQWLFLGLWLLTALAWLISARRNKTVTRPDTVEADQVNNHYLQLLSACKKNDGQAVLDNLVPWLNVKLKNDKSDFTPARNLADVNQIIDHQPFEQALSELQASYYGKEQITWQGKAMFNALQQVQKQKLSRHRQIKLTLNPQ